MTYNKWMTVSESKQPPTGPNRHTGSAGRKQLVAHLPAENCRWRLVIEPTLEEITSSQQANNVIDTHTSDSQHTWRRSGKQSRGIAAEHTQQLEMISVPSKLRMSSVPTSALTWRMISGTARAPE